MKFPRGRIVQFARYPLPGRVKTRLQGALPDESILRLHNQLVRDVNALLNRGRLAPVEFHYSNDHPLPARDPFLASLSAAKFNRQADGDLGWKMYRAFRQILRPEGTSDYAILVGSDCPFLEEGILEEALGVLAGGGDAVLGPAEDGGYYLIGLRHPVAEIFTGVPWGTGNVLAKTLAKMADSGLDCHLLTKLADIDSPEDIPKLTKKAGFGWLNPNKFNK